MLANHAQDMQFLGAACSLIGVFMLALAAIPVVVIFKKLRRK